jgi:hypothetical protein
MPTLDENLTLEELLSDPLTQLVMRSDNITVADTARAFAEARIALDVRRNPHIMAQYGCRAPWRPCGSRSYRDA